MHPIGQNNLLLYPHFGIDFVQPPQFLNSEDSETVTLDCFPSSLLNIIQHVRLSTVNNVYHIATVICCISIPLEDSKYTGKLMTLGGSYFISRIRQLITSHVRTRNHLTTSDKVFEKHSGRHVLPSLSRIQWCVFQTSFLSETHISNIWMLALPTGCQH